MEDNEFEEVTIISHTDHGTSVLPQSTAERLMKEIKLEVTQKISQNENVKLGSLQHSTTPTLLDSIYQIVKKRGFIECYTRFFSKDPWAQDHYLLGVANGIYRTDWSTATQGTTNRNFVYFIQPWGDRILVAQNGNSVIILDKDFQYVKKTESLSGTESRSEEHTSELQSQ